MKRGYFAVWRKIQDHEFYKEPRVFSKYEAWIDILMEAQHNPEPQRLIFGMTVLTCNYGESLKSNVTWANRWRWTESKVRRFFKLLKNMGQIDVKNEVVTTRISVINYNIYDPKRLANAEQTPSERRASDEQVTTDKNVNNVKKDIYGEFKNVFLYLTEYEKLKSSFGLQGTELRIEKLSSYIASKGRKYKSHYATVLTWERKNEKEHPQTKHQKPLTMEDVENGKLEQNG